MNGFIKNQIKWKHQIYKNYIKTVVKTKFLEATSLVSEVISRRNEEYQNHKALKLTDPRTTNESKSLEQFFPMPMYTFR